MANELEIRQDGIGGLVEDAPLTSGATTLTSAALAALVAVGATQFAWVILDPDGIGGAPEHVKVTAHTAGATTATIARGQNGTTARQHDANTRWLHGPIAADFGLAQLIGATYYKPGADGIVGPSPGTATTLTDLDATNLKVDFIVPPSGMVVLVLEAMSGQSAINLNLTWAARDGASNIADTSRFVTNTAEYFRHHTRAKATGLTPGTATTWKWAYKVSSGNTTHQAGPGYGPMAMEVWAVSL